MPRRDWVGAMSKGKARMCVWVCCFYEQILLIGRRRGWCAYPQMHISLHHLDEFVQCSMPVRHFLFPINSFPFSFSIFLFFVIEHSVPSSLHSFTKESRCNLQTAKLHCCQLRHVVFLTTHFYEIILTKMEKKNGAGEGDEEAEDVLRWCIRRRHSTRISFTYSFVFSFIRHFFRISRARKGAKEEDNIWSIVCKCSECMLYGTICRA